jgi:hypothetical protein
MSALSEILNGEIDENDLIASFSSTEITKEIVSDTLNVTLEKDILIGEVTND